MRLTFGSSKNGDVAEALKNISSPAALFFTVADEKMLEHTAIEIEKVFRIYHLLEALAKHIWTNSFLMQVSL